MRTHLRLTVLTLAALAIVPTAQGFAQSSPRQASSGEGDEDGDRLVCRRSIDTGSLVKGRRTCLTQAQWERQAERQSKAATEVQERMRTSPSGGE